MAERNADQVADWNGQSGERWVAHQARLDARLAVFGQAAIEAAAPATGERVLDVGCGAGASSLALAACVGAGGQVLGVDISEPLIGRARALAPQDTPALFRVADASSAELPEGAFDILFAHPRNKPSASLHESLGLATVNTPLGIALKVDERRETSMPGIYAAGDLANPLMPSVTLASSHGATAGISAQQSMLV